MSNKQAIKKREEMKEKDLWAITDLYKTDEQWQEEYDKVKELADRLSKFQGRLLESATTLYEFLSLQDETSKLFERVYVYANQKYHENTANGTYQNLSDLAGQLMTSYSSSTSFVTSELLQLTNQQLEQFFEAEPKLIVYKRYINNILRKKPHILSAEEEKLLAMASDMAENAGTIFTMFNNADIKFPLVHDEEGNEVELSHGRYSLFLQSKDRSVRKEAFEALYKTYEAFKNTLAAAYSGNVKKEIFYAKARKYPSTLKMALDDSNVDLSVYKNLIETVHDYLPAMYDYVALRKQLLGVDELHMYDLYAPLISDVQETIPFEEAKKTVYEALAPLGEDYLAILKEGFDSRWIDVYENEGKRSGAYSWGAYGTHPYVLLNYQDNLNNMFTLAHEMGHAIHSYLSDQTQPYIYAGYKIFVAEVASTCNEALLMHHLLKTTTDEKKRAYLINYHLEQYRTTLFRQVMFAEFEMITHDMAEQGEALTASKLCEVYHTLIRTYFGDDIVIDQEIDMEWARIPHFYNSFYVYQYATGYSAAIALSRKILAEGEPAVKRYLTFLSSGSSKDPIELLKEAGVDLSTKEPVKVALDYFKELITLL